MLKILILINTSLHEKDNYDWIERKDKENEETWFAVNFATKMTFTSTVVVVGCTS